MGPEVSDQPEQDGESEGGIAQSPHHDAQTAAGTGDPAPTSDEGYDAFVRKIRIGEHPDKVRFVMELSEPIRFEIRSEGGGKEIIVDMPGVAWNAIRHWRAKETPIVAGFDAEGVTRFETEALAGGGTRLRIIARSTMSVSQSGLVRPEPEEGQGDRLFIDLVK
jgi:N-acetylmuramoyl-L-alanine amidase